MSVFELVSDYKPTGDQPKAIKQIVDNLNNGINRMTLLGATGTGKTFTMANIIKEYGKKTLILAHNKTLAGQLYNEIKSLFPHNHVEFFISYYDYYQPEAYVASSDTYIEKDAKINEEIDEMRHSATAALIDYDDVIVVASVSCIYGIGDPEEYKKSMLCLRVGESYNRKALLRRLVEMQYNRNEMDFQRGSFRSKGDVLEIIQPSEHKNGIRVEFFDDEIERIRLFDITTGQVIESVQYVNIFAATLFMTSKEKLEEAIKRIKTELLIQKNKFLKENKPLEAERIEQRTNYDIEMLQEIGTCPGVENYSRHLTLRKEGETPATLLDFFPDDFLLIVDESHVTLPQVRGMYNGDRSRKQTLVDYGFRLPSALDNRPLRFEEFDKHIKHALYVSATPGDFEKQYPVIEQIIRPTGLLDPKITVRPTLGQVDDIYAEIVKRVAKNERVLVTTLTIKMSEDLTAYLKKLDLKVAYLHSKIKSLERLEILRDLRLGKYDVLVGINLLREGLDLPEVSLVCILDADKQGFLRSERSLIQTIGRAARNANGEVIMYADTISPSMKEAIEETARRRQIQDEYNKEHHIVPKTIVKAIPEKIQIKAYQEESKKEKKMTKVEKEDLIARLNEEMLQYARELNFEMAAQVRDAIMELYKIGNGPSSSHTMGPKKAALYFLENYPNLDSYKVYLYGSLALTGKGHLTDYIIAKTIPNAQIIFDYKTETKHPNTLIIEGYQNNNLVAKETFYSIGGGNIQIEGEAVAKAKEVYAENSFSAIKTYLKEKNINLVEYVNVHENIDNYLGEVLDVMYNTLKDGLNKTGILPGKLKVKRKAREIYFSTSKSALDYDSDRRKLMAYAYAVSEENASGGLVVTSPTCGACGVLPAVIFYLKEKYHTTREEEINGLKIAGIIGNIVSYNASISGAYAGCQAEVGTATSMAASYAAYILKGELLNIERAAEIALEHNLGLTCDPVGGYVQIPCIERNALGALRALDSALLSLYLNAKEAKISFDTVVSTMLETGLSLPRALKETSEGGLAKNYHEVEDERK